MNKTTRTEKAPRVVPFQQTGSGYYYSVVDGIKGGVFLDTKTGRVYLLTVECPGELNITDPNGGAQVVLDTILQHKERLAGT